jgi:alpha-galactosidase
VDTVCSGINHQTWYLHIQHNGCEVTKEDLNAAFERHPAFSRQEMVRIDVLKQFGFYSTESNRHLPEYLPQYRKQPDHIMDWISLDE